MKDIISDFSKAKHVLMNHFGCKDDFYIKVATDCKWYIKNIDGIYFVGRQLSEDKKPVEAVVVRKDGAPYLFNKHGYTMVICIDCVKIALILDNSKKIEAV